MPLDTGEMLGERYRIVKLLGQGGMGAVYRAWDTRLNRPVALKEMIPQSGLDVNMLSQLRGQFQQEAQVLATLAHANLVRVTDYFSGDGNEYLVMDFVEGESLADRIQREGAQSEKQVLAWARQLLDALAYCHGQGVIHRDIKPQNIIVTPEGRAVLVDFGLVKLWDPQDPRTQTVMRGAGTPEYAPPEQYDMGLGHTDPRSDIYSLGATLYHALTGQVPPTATQRMASPTTFVPPSRVNVGVTPATEAVVLKALQIAMDDRFQSAEEMAQALGGEARPPLVAPIRGQLEDRQVTPTTVIEPSAKRKPGILLGLGGAGLAVVGLLCLVAAAGAVLIGLFVMGGDNGGGTTPTAPLLATPAALVTNTPVPEIGDILFEDDFESPASGWEIGEYETGSVGYERGVYVVTSLGHNDTMWGTANRSFDDVVVEVDATQVSAGPANDNDYGVVCREQGNGDGYHLLISGDGFYAIVRSEGGSFEWLVDWTESNAINQGNATNRIRGVCDGSTLTLFVNGQRLATAEDGTFTSGDIALTATSYEDGPTEVHFDNLTARTP
ncbi:MAG TPA: serine/threonine-protein kinase [Anaerolineae bacterium]|nr:serine/threonine-protein kinase [Anaerolineae bacterium]